MNDTNNQPAAPAHAEASWLTKLLSASVLLCCAALIAVSSLHWGGMVLDVSVWLFPVGAALWLLIAFASVRNIIRGVTTGGWLELFVLLWLVYALFSYFRAPAEYTARLEWLWILTYAGVFIALRNLVHLQRWHFWLLGAILLCATATCIFGLMHHEAVYDIWGLPRPDYGRRISGTFGCPNHFGDFLAMSGLVAVGLGFFNKLKWPVRLVCFYLFLMFSVGIFYSFSRGSVLAWTAGVIAATVFIFIDNRAPLKLRLLFLLAVVLGIAGCVLVIASNEFAVARVEQAMRGDVRLLLAQDAIKIWEGNKLLGSGMATFDFWHQRLHQAAFYGRAIYTHNDYLNLLSDYGVTGALIVSGFLVALVARLSARTHRDLSPAEPQIAVRVAWCVLAAMAVHSTFDFNLHIPACALAFFAIAAIGSAQIMRRPAEHWYTHGGGLALIVSAGVAVFFLTTLTSRTVQSLRLIDPDDSQLTSWTPEQVAAKVEQLRRIDPANAAAFETAGDILRCQAAMLNGQITTAYDANDQPAVLRLLGERETLGQQALRYYSLAQTANPLADTALLKQALTLDTLRRYEEAYLYHTKALANQPYNSTFHYYYAFHLAAVGQYRMARQEFQTALRAPVIRNADKNIRSLAEEALKIMPED